MSVTVTRRRATEAELKELPKVRKLAQPLVVAWFIATVFFGIMAAILQLVLGLLPRFVAVPWWAIDVLPWVLAGAADVFVVVEVVRTWVGLRRRIEVPATSPEVDELVVRDAQVVALADSGPTWCFEVEPGRVLLLSGGRLTVPATYGAPKPDRRFRGFANGLEAPHSFPSASFTLVRDPWSGEVLSIRVEGPYVPPTASPVRAKAILRNSELLDGDLANLARVLGA